MMTDSDPLPHLLRLLDDPSPTVREAVTARLRAYGNRLPPLLAALPERPPPTTLQLLTRMLDDERRERLLTDWQAWLAAGTGPASLERGLSRIGSHVGQREDDDRLSRQLDALAAAYRETHLADDPRTLARFLFETRGLRGAHLDYYAPRHSDLVGVLQTGQGLPISLACIYILVGRRLGLPLEGCNYPGHFLARYDVQDQVYLIDCYDRGRFITLEEVLQFNPSDEPVLRREILARPSAASLLARVLRNLAQAYARSGDPEQAALMTALLALHA